MAAVRRVAIEVGKGQPGRARAVVRIAAAIAAVASRRRRRARLRAGGPIGDVLNVPDRVGARRGRRPAVRGGVAGIHGGQPRPQDHAAHAVLVLDRPVGGMGRHHARLLGDLRQGRDGHGLGLYGVVGVRDVRRLLVVAPREPHASTPMPAEPNEATALFKYGAPRAPAALLSQALFYTDLAVLSHFLKSSPEVSVYAATIRVSQALVLFLIAVSLHVQPVRGGPLRARLEGPVERPVQADHALDAGRHDPAAPAVHGGAGPILHLSSAPGTGGELLAAGPADRPDRERERGRRGLHPDHGGPHRAGISWCTPCRSRST